MLRLDDPNVRQSKLGGKNFLIFKNDNGVSEVIRKSGSYASSEVAAYIKILEKNSFFVDVGSNIGAILFQLSNRVKNFSALGFEPIKYYYDLSIINLFNTESVNIFNFAIGNCKKLSYAPVINTGGVGNYGSVNLDFNTGRRLPVPMIRLDDFILLREKRPGLIKIDVEGSEAEVLEGCSGLVNSEIIVSFEGDRRKSAMSAVQKALALFQNVYACRFGGSGELVSIMFFASNKRLDLSEFGMFEPITTSAEYDQILSKFNIVPHP